MSSQQVLGAREEVHKLFGILPVPAKSYLVLMSPRSGSTLLCAGLQKIQFGNPVEAFHYNIPRIRRLYGWDIDFSNPYVYIKKALDYQTVEGIFGMKFDWAQFEVFLRVARQMTDPSGIPLSDADVVDVFFPDVSYVLLKRRNKIKQAVSFAKALQDGVWHIDASEDEESAREYSNPAVYSRELIENCLDILLSYDAAWDNYLRKYHPPSLEMWYEDLAKDYFGKMRDIYAFLGIQTEEIPEPALKKTANDISAEWAKRFSEETGWLKDRGISASLAEGDLTTAFIDRMQLLTRKAEQDTWQKIPTNRPAVKQLYRLWNRARRKLDRTKGQQSTRKTP